MTYIPITPFRRAVDARVLASARVTEEVLPETGANKWEVLRELGVARRVYDLSDRDITVLQALLSFHPDVTLGEGGEVPVVFPSNRAICERLGGMPCSTMRRHLSHLIAAGLILRRDSPNGKRYARTRGGTREAFGFDLSPLVLRLGEICDHAETARAEQERHTRLRTTVSLMRRDLAGLAAYGAEQRPDLRIWDRFEDLAALTGRDLRRKLETEALEGLEEVLLRALCEARAVLEPSESENMSINDVPCEHHYQNSKTDLHDLEPHLESEGSEPDAPDDPPEQDLPNIPLALVVASCPEILAYGQGAIRHWHDLVRAADLVRPMMGISPSAWHEAQVAMGPEQAAVVVAAMLERFADIRAPGGYLRSLTRKAEAGAFSCAPMVMALRRREAA